MVILFSFIQKTRRETANKPCSCGRNSQGLKLLKVIGVEIHNVFPEKKKKKTLFGLFQNRYCCCLCLCIFFSALCSLYNLTNTRIPLSSPILCILKKLYMDTDIQILSVVFIQKARGFIARILRLTRSYISSFCS